MGPVEERQNLTAPPLPAVDRDVVAALRARLAEVGYTTDRIAERLGGGGRVSFTPADIAVQLRRLPAEEPFGAVVRLFLLGTTVAVDHASAAMRPLDLPALKRSGWLEPRDGGVGATMKVVPHGDLLIASDQETDGPTGSDWVAGVHPPSVTLAKLTVRPTVERALDVGTGNGIQALLASRHASSVVATDVNPRALAVAALNARLNEVDNIEYRQGSFFEPAADDRFDIVTCNPPYVISPETRYAFRDSDLEGDEVSRRVVRAAPRVLREGGFAHLLVSWAHPPGDWSSPLEAWVDSCGCDSWLLHFGSDDPLTYAAEWLKPVARAGPAAFDGALERWTAYLEQQKIEAIAHGAVILRRRSGGPNWTRKDTCSLDRLEQAGDHILRVFDSHDYLHSLTDPRQLLDAKLVVVEPHQLEQTTVYRDGRAEPQPSVLTLDDGIRFRLALDEHTTALLPLLDGRRAVREVIAHRITELRLQRTEADAFETAALPVIQRLIELGLLEQRPTPAAPPA